MHERPIFNNNSTTLNGGFKHIYESLETARGCWKYIIQDDRVS